MKLVLDERETGLYSAILQLQQNQKVKIEIEIEKRVLDLGDILIVSSNNNDEKKEDIILLMIERKSLSDLVASIKDGRYEEQSHRLQHASGIPNHNIIYIIEGMFSQLWSLQDKKMILSAMTSLSFFKGFSVIRTCSISETAEFLVNMGDKIERDMKKGKKSAFSNQISQISPTKIIETREEEEVGQVVEEEIKTGEEVVEEEEEEVEQVKEEQKKYCEVVKKVKKENITKDNMGEIILCQIPGISSTTAIAIMNYVDRSLIKLLDILKTSPEELQNIKIGKTGEKQRKISKKNIENMIYFLL